MKACEALRTSTPLALPLMGLSSTPNSCVWEPGAANDIEGVDALRPTLAIPPDRRR